MPSLLLCDYPTDTRSLCRDLGIPDDCIRDRYGSTPPVMRADIPYLLDSERPWSDQDICASLEPHGPLLTRMCTDYGGPTTLALADIRQDLLQFGRNSLTGVGAGSGLVHSRAERLRQALGEYQEAVFTYHRATHGTSRPGCSSRQVGSWAPSR